jgi:hypothetical protein
MKITAPISAIQQLIDRGSYSDTRFQKDTLDALGFFVLRSGISPEKANQYLDTYRELTAQGVLKRSELHSTEIKISHVNDFHDLHTSAGLQHVWPQLFSGTVGASFKRILVKAADSPKPVILHQDIGYQYGETEQYSFFVALTECGMTNGGLKLYPGTHKLGYLGDAGTLNEEILPNDLPVCSPVLFPGDVLIMHSATWHFSDAYVSGNDRVYIELHVLDGNSPFSRETIAGTSTMGWKVDYDPVMREEAAFFKVSRSQSLAAARAALSKLQG